MPGGLQNGRRQPENVFFLCFIHLQWINLFFAVSPFASSFLFAAYNTPKRTKTNTQETQKPHQKRTPTQETKQQRNKTNCTPKTGEDAENWVPSYFCFIVLFVFLVSCLFGSLFLLKGWQNKKVAGPNLLLLLPA